MRGGPGRTAVGSHFRGHQPLRSRTVAHQHRLSWPQLGEAEPAQRLHVHEDVGRAFAARQETKAAQAIEPFHLRALESAGRRDGHQVAYEGARVVVEVVQRSRGLQAFRILSMDESTALHPAQMPPPRTHVSVTPTSGLERAQVKWFNRLRGFGFLTRGEGTPDIFVHMETLRRYGIAELRPGQFVLVRFGPGPKGLMAAEVRPEGVLGPASH